MKLLFFTPACRIGQSLLMDRAYEGDKMRAVARKLGYNPVVPPKTEYSLTALGKTLVPIVDAMSGWGHEYFKYLGVPDPCPED